MAWYLAQGELNLTVFHYITEDRVHLILPYSTVRRSNGLTQKGFYCDISISVGMNFLAIFQERMEWPHKCMCIRVCARVHACMHEPRAFD
jgi:hypothetical protein